MDLAARVAQRLETRWSVAAWTTICVRLIDARDAAASKDRAATPPHYLAAAWPPMTQGPVRWPEAVAIGSPEAHHALHELLVRLPAQARLCLVTLDDVDAALAADVLATVDRNLEPYQREALAAFAAHERERSRQALASRYSDRDAGYERFRGRAGVRDA